ncbi:tRNA pseudouridine38-40 synthase [Bryocella elongata]|uniref:tRNA pseudouridine synthase A n=1 Tax=Bryocella elongata TaxID=863522 RepID=A0A1H5U665_9BACT|nr:tRNA pseudouridine(38-40) synthase TruA [Bryocella elongata]SEF69948.1 tRNA pseudouridine38-40 synthase [Bryocella elongata]
MPHFKLTLSYDGTPYHGWQVQPDLSTVQGCLAHAIAEVTGENVLPQGSGRTDAGVHALGQVASFSLAVRIPVANLHRALNRVLPPSIRVLTTEEVDASFHARHSSRGKIYEYRLFERRRHGGPLLAGRLPERACSPFLAPWVWDCRWPLDLAAMESGATPLIGTQDFSSFAAGDLDKGQRLADDDSDPGESGPNPIKTIHSIALARTEELLTFRIHGSGFLHHMVRNIVGTLVEIGRGALTPERMTGILTARDRSAAGPTAPAKGLFLAEVIYPPHPIFEHMRLDRTSLEASGMESRGMDIVAEHEEVAR